METLATGLLVAHIAVGFTALAVGPFAMFSAKGGTLHRRAGMIYVWAMVAVVITAVVLAVYRTNLFLLGIAVFSFYLTFSGYRALFHKKLHKGVGVTALDWSVSGLTFLFGLGLLVYGFIDNFNVLPLFFGVLTIVMVAREVRKYRGHTAKGEWFFAHIIGMLAAYIATFTAFVVTNVTFLPAMVVWLTPTVVGSVGIALTISYYKSKFSRGRTAADVAKIRIQT